MFFPYILSEAPSNPNPSDELEMLLVVLRYHGVVAIQMEMV